MKNETIFEDDDDTEMKFPILVKSIEIEDVDYTSFRGCGYPVRIRPCDEKYDGKTFLGLMLGDFPLWQFASFNEEIGELRVCMIKNPAIFVPSLKKIIFGAESFWGEIESENDMKDITDPEIDNLWYMKEIKKMAEKKSKKWKNQKKGTKGK